MMVIAFLGGLILNVMPCVLPVISLKLGTVMGMGHQPLGQVRVSFLMTAAGGHYLFHAFGRRSSGLTAGRGCDWLGHPVSESNLFGICRQCYCSIWPCDAGCYQLACSPIYSAVWGGEWGKVKKAQVLRVTFYQGHWQRF